MSNVIDFPKKTPNVERIEDAVIAALEQCKRVEDYGPIFTMLLGSLITTYEEALKASPIGAAQQMCLIFRHFGTAFAEIAANWRNVDDMNRSTLTQTFADEFKKCAEEMQELLETYARMVVDAGSGPGSRGI